MKLRLLAAALMLISPAQLRAAVVQFDEVIFRVRGIVETEKTLRISGYIGDGLITTEDFLPSQQRGFLGQVDLTPSEDEVTIDFDVTDFVNNLPEGTEFFGFQLSESESSGSVVTIEYLVLGTFLALALIVGASAVVQGEAEVTLGDLGELVGPINLGPLPHHIMNPPGPTETRGAVEFAVVNSIPEPTSLALLGLTAAGFCGVRLRRRPTSKG